MNRRTFLKIAGLTIGGAFIPPLDVEWPPGVRTKFDVDQDVFAFTIDDGWSGANILPFVKFCREHGLRATWFANGTGIRRVREEPEILEIMTEDAWTVGYHTMHHPSIEDQKKYSRQDWINDYTQWWDIANETFKGLPWIVVPYARAAGGFFSNNFMAMCESVTLTPYAWSQDPYELVRGAEIGRGDIFLTHFRDSEWRWFEHVAALELQTADLMTLENLEVVTHYENLWRSDLPNCGGDVGAPPCLYEVKKNGRIPPTNA